MAYLNVMPTYRVITTLVVVQVTQRRGSVLVGTRLVEQFVVVGQAAVHERGAARRWTKKAAEGGGSGTSEVSKCADKRECLCLCARRVLALADCSVTRREGRNEGLGAGEEERRGLIVSTHEGVQQTRSGQEGAWCSVLAQTIHQGADELWEHVDGPRDGHRQQRCLGGVGEQGVAQEREGDGFGVFGSERGKGVQRGQWRSDGCAGEASSCQRGHGELEDGDEGVGSVDGGCCDAGCKVWDGLCCELWRGRP